MNLWCDLLVEHPLFLGWFRLPSSSTPDLIQASDCEMVDWSSWSLYLKQEGSVTCSWKEKESWFVEYALRVIIIICRNALWKRMRWITNDTSFRTSFASQGREIPTTGIHKKRFCPSQHHDLFIKKPGIATPTYVFFIMNQRHYSIIKNAKVITPGGVTWTGCLLGSCAPSQENSARAVHERINPCCANESFVFTVRHQTRVGVTRHQSERGS